MMTRKEILESPDYWLEHLQDDLYGQVVTYLEKEKMNQTQFAEKLGVSKGYVSQIMNGHFNYTVRKLIELGLAIGVVPRVVFQALDDIILQEATQKMFEVAATGQFVSVSRDATATGVIDPNNGIQPSTHQIAA